MFSLRNRVQLVERDENPRPLRNCVVSYDEKGQAVFTPADVVAPSQAEDFSVSVNSRYGRISSGSNVRFTSDPVDFDDRLNDLFDN